MREILFRGKLANGKWAYGNLDIGYNGVCIITPDRTLLGSYGQVDPETVGQYTGLKDKNGQRIFEGDVVEQHVQGDILVCRGVINFDERNARFAHQLRTMNPALCLFNSEAWEVIGNIHDNPELVKEEPK